MASSRRNICAGLTSVLASVRAELVPFRAKQECVRWVLRASLHDSKCAVQEGIRRRISFQMLKYMTVDMGRPGTGMGAETKTATATLRGNLSMASTRLLPPKLWPTRTSLSLSGAAATASSSGRE